MFASVNRQTTSRSNSRPVTALRADVVICTYTLARWNLLAQSVESVLAQRIAPHRLIIVVDHNQELLER